MNAVRSALTVIFAACLLPVAQRAGAKEIIERSASKRYQIRPAYYPEPGTGSRLFFHLAVYDVKARKQIFVSDSGFDPWQGKDHLVLFHSSLPIFAMTVREGRRYGHSELYAIRGEEVERLVVPDYQSEALEKVGATRPFNVMFDSIESWRGNNHRLILYYDTCRPGTAEGSRTRADYAGSYTAAVTLHVSPTEKPPTVKLQHLVVKPD